jgi:hypothetical protein
MPRHGIVRALQVQGAPPALFAVVVSPTNDNKDKGGRRAPAIPGGSPYPEVVFRVEVLFTLSKSVAGVRVGLNIRCAPEIAALRRPVKNKKRTLYGAFSV